MVVVGNAKQEVLMKCCVGNVPGWGVTPEFALQVWFGRKVNDCAVVAELTTANGLPD